MNKNNNKLGYLFIFIAGSLWGLIGILVKEMEAYGANTQTISFLRVSFAFMILLFFCIIKSGVKSLRINFHTLLICASLGIICHGFYNICYNTAVMKTGIAVSAVLLDIAPVFTFILSVFLFGEKITSKKIVAILINIAGCILTVTNGSFSFPQMAVTGILMGLGAGLCYSMTAIIGQYATNDTNAYIMSLYSYLFASLFLGIFASTESSSLILNKGILFWGFLYALIPTAIAYVIYYQGIKKITENSKVPVVASIEVVIASMIGVFFYQEQLGNWSILGIILVLLSIVIMNLPTTNKITAQHSTPVSYDTHTD